MKNIFIACLLCLFSLPAWATDKESLLDKVLAEGKITCGYAMWKPMMYKDMEKNALTGTSYELMEEIGRRLDLKIEWKEETGWGTIIEGQKTGRYDMICTGLAISSARSKFIDFSAPYLYSPLHVAVRADDKRFDKNYRTLNDAPYKIAVLEGEMSAIIAAQTFPKAQISAMPQITDYSLLLKEVEAGKADATLIEPSTFADYQANNPGKLKLVSIKNPVSVIPVGFGLLQDQLAFSQMINTTLREIILDGTAERLIKKHEPRDGIFLPVEKGYVH